MLTCPQSRLISLLTANSLALLFFPSLLKKNEPHVWICLSILAVTSEGLIQVRPSLKSGEELSCSEFDENRRLERHFQTNDVIGKDTQSLEITNCFPAGHCARALQTEGKHIAVPQATLCPRGMKELMVSPCKLSSPYKRKRKFISPAVCRTTWGQKTPPCSLTIAYANVVKTNGEHWKINSEVLELSYRDRGNFEYCQHSIRACRMLYRCFIMEVLNLLSTHCSFRHKKYKSNS